MLSRWWRPRFGDGPPVAGWPGIGTKELGNGAIVVSSDARSLTDIDALASRVKAEFETFDLLFANAGFGGRAPLDSMTEAISDEMFNLNAKGAFFAVQKLAPLIHRGGAVVLTTSIANVKGMPGLAAYGGAKAALRAFARVLAAELLPRDIRVNAVTPGPIDTPIMAKSFPDKASRLPPSPGSRWNTIHSDETLPRDRPGGNREGRSLPSSVRRDVQQLGAEFPVDGGWSQVWRPSPAWVVATTARESFAMISVAGKGFGITPN